MMIFTGAFLGAGDQTYLVIVAGAAFSSILTVAYGAEAIRKSMFGPAKEGLNLEKAEVSMLIPIAAMLILSLAFFFLPWLVLVPLGAKKVLVKVLFTAFVSFLVYISLVGSLGTDELTIGLIIAGIVGIITRNLVVSDEKKSWTRSGG